MMLLIVGALELKFSCPDNYVFFEHTNTCGQCQSSKVYDEVQKRCVCPLGYVQSSSGTCNSCNPGVAAAGGQFCKTGVNTNTAPNAKDEYYNMIPCPPGQSLFQDIETGNYVCVVDSKVDYNLFAEEIDLSNYNSNLCSADYSYSTTFQTCYLTSDYQDPSADEDDYDLHKQANIAYAVCKTGMSARACSSLLNMCIYFGKQSSECLNYNTLQTLSEDVYQTMATPASTVPIVALMG